MLLSFFPTGRGVKPEKLVFLKEGPATVSAMKKGRVADEYIIRIFNPVQEAITAKAVFPIINRNYEITLKGCEFKTFVLNTATGDIKEADVLERVLV